MKTINDKPYVPGDLLQALRKQWDIIDKLATVKERRPDDVSRTSAS
jgi:hypothetical protein